MHVCVCFPPSVCLCHRGPTAPDPPTPQHHPHHPRVFVLRAGSRRGSREHWRPRLTEEKSPPRRDKRIAGEDGGQGNSGQNQHTAGRSCLQEQSWHLTEDEYVHSDSEWPRSMGLQTTGRKGLQHATHHLQGKSPYCETKRQQAQTIGVVINS